ncbi:diguanylate cyclase [Aliikangiella sp. IMCC44359]|uniref:diguanylate cyclase n=1 Tax=Aliikangiella sp. IMCC44359 TaxID=3459125 RepID=UPI00403AF82D
MPHNEIKILLIEDDSDDIYLIKNYLEKDKKTKYHFQTFSSLRESKKHLGCCEHDVVILDLGLEDSEGLDTLKKFITFKFNAPIIVLTGINNEEMGEKAIKIGAEDYLSKSMLNQALLTKTIKYSIERHALYLKIKTQAEQDPLTKLPNRKVFFEKLETLINQGKRNQLTIALIMIDLDGFKPINDTLGHQAGDELLQKFSARLKKTVRISDAIARFGGDEFCMLVTNYKNTEELLQIVNNKHEELNKPYLIDNNGKNESIQIGVSMGVAEWHKDISSKKLIAIADQALYKSKETNKGGITLGSCCKKREG